MTKKELVAAINALPGVKVTDRARKATLIEILEERKTPKSTPLYLGAKAPKKPLGFFEWMFGK